MGLSSHPEFKLTEFDDMMEFFISSLESWRYTMHFNDFTLGGHSFGGYIAGFYAIKH